MTASLPTDPVSSDPCEKCGTPVYGYVEQRCCDGRECGCMGRPLEPCWCTGCWDAWEAQSKANRNIPALKDLTP